MRDRRPRFPVARSISRSEGSRGRTRGRVDRGLRPRRAPQVRVEDHAGGVDHGDEAGGRGGRGGPTGLSGPGRHRPCPTAPRTHRDGAPARRRAPRRRVAGRRRPAARARPRRPRAPPRGPPRALGARAPVAPRPARAPRTADVRRASPSPVPRHPGPQRAHRPVRQPPLHRVWRVVSGSSGRPPFGPLAISRGAGLHSGTRRARGPRPERHFHGAGARSRLPADTRGQRDRERRCGGWDARLCGGSARSSRRLLSS